MTFFTDLETNNSGYNLSHLGVFMLMGVSAMFRALSRTIRPNTVTRVHK